VDGHVAFYTQRGDARAAAKRIGRMMFEE